MGELWTRVVRVVRFEVRIWVSLGRWVARRPDVDGGEPFGYAQAVTPVLLLWIFASAVEVPIVHLLVPWPAVRLVLLVLSVWGLLWMVGLLASYRAYPHLLTPDGLRVRSGPGIDVRVPWAAVEAVERRHEHLGSSARTLQPLETAAGTELRVATSGEVDVRVRLREPTVVATPRGPLEVVAVSLHVDDPRAFVARTRERLTAVRER